MLVPSNTANLILSVHLIDDDGLPITGKAYNTAGLVVSYREDSASAYTTVTLVDGTLGTYIANSWKEIGLGEYQFCLPNSAIVDGRETKLKIAVDSNLPLFDSIQARLPVGSGSGDKLVAFNLSSDASAVAGARITVLSGSLVVAGGLTDAGGDLDVYLPSGSYTVRVANSPIYETLAEQSLTVSADVEVSYSLTAVVIPTPSNPALCTVRFIAQKNLQAISDAKVTAELDGDNITTDSVLVESAVLSGRTNSSGYVDLVLIQSSQFSRGGNYNIRVTSPNGNVIHARTVTVPSTSTAYAEDLPDA
jgi:hypothetical protein